MPEAIELPRISRLTWDAYLARCRAACPAEFAPPTTATRKAVKCGQPKASVGDAGREDDGPGRHSEPSLEAQVDSPFTTGHP
jgi:hypothetical protein